MIIIRKYDLVPFLTLLLGLFCNSNVREMCVAFETHQLKAFQCQVLNSAFIWHGGLKSELLQNGLIDLFSNMNRIDIKTKLGIWSLQICM